MPNRLSCAALLLVAAFVCTSCLIVSKSSLIDPRRSKTDVRLKGRWIGLDKLTDVYAIFDGGSSLETNIISGKGPTKESELMFEVAAGSIGKHRYLSLKLRDEAADAGYLLARYSIENDVMTIWLLDSSLIDAAISKGELKSEKGGSSTTLLTDSPGKITAFIRANQDSPELFELLGTFRKQKNE